MSTAPCFKCAERTGICHAACPKYLSYRALIDKEAIAKEKSNQLQADIMGMSNHIKDYLNRKGSTNNTRKKGLKDG